MNKMKKSESQSFFNLGFISVMFSYALLEAL